MGLVNYAHVSFGGVPPISRPVIHKKMPVHDWLWDYYTDDKHFVRRDTNPCPKQGSGVFEDYIAVVEQRGAFFT